MKPEPNENNNLNYESEPFKSLAYAFKDASRMDKQAVQKLIRALRDHEVRIAKLEQAKGG